MYHERYILNVSGHIFDEFVNFLRIDKDELLSCNVRLFTQKQINIIEQLFDKILFEIQSRIPIHQNKTLRLYFSHLLFELSNGTPAPERDTNMSDTYDIILYIRQHFYENITLETISNKFSISKSHLCRTFKKALGKTFSEFLAELRINYAKELLKQTKLTTTHISAECGYTNYSYFMSQFKKITCTTPKEYRKSLN